MLVQIKPSSLQTEGSGGSQGHWGQCQDLRGSSGLQIVPNVLQDVPNPSVLPVPATATAELQAVFAVDGRCT